MEAILTVQQLHWAFIRRYLNAAGTTLALWDHVLTVGDEIEYFWSRKSWTPSTMLFLGFRYITMLGLIFMAAISAGSIRPTVQICRSLTTAMCTLVVLGVCSSHAIIALRVFALWDHRRGALTALWVMFAVTYGSVFTFFVMLVKYFYDHVSFVSTIDNCIIIGKLDLNVGIWASLLAFNAVTIVLTIGSALERPYRQGKEVIDRLKRDGCASFLLLTATCVLNLAMQTDPENGYAAFVLVWALDVSILSRLVLQMESVKARYTRPRCVSAGDVLQLSDVQRRRDSS